MRYITRRPLGESIEIARNGFNYKKAILKYLFVVVIHFLMVSFTLFNFVPLMMDIEDAKMYISYLLKICLGVYPFWLVYSVSRDKKINNKKVYSALQVVESVAEEMQEMGYDVEKQNLLDADIETLDVDKKVVGESLLKKAIVESGEKIIKLRDRKFKLIVLREVVNLVREFAYIEPVPDVKVHSLDEEEYSKILEKKNK